MGSGDPGHQTAHLPNNVIIPGTSKGRIEDLKFGYSQVVNPWYLMKKGSMRPIVSYLYLFRAILGNDRRLQITLETLYLCVLVNQGNLG